MSPIEHCPPEISSTIIACLSGNDLVSASRVSRDWHTIAQPLLYRKPILVNRVEPPSALYMFVRTLLSTGGEILAKHVRSLTLGWDNYECEPPAEPQSDLELFTDAASRLGLGDPFVSDGAQVVLLMHLLPSLRTLEVITPEDMDEFDELIKSHHATKTTASLPLALQSIREFIWCTGHTNRGVSSTMLLTLMRLPCIRIIDVIMVNEVERPSTGTTIANIATANSAVTHLTLSSPEMPTRLLAGILKLPRALTHFSYRGRFGNSFSIPELSTALQPLQLTLRHLDLDTFWCSGGPMMQHSGITTPLGSLRGWPVLCSLRISLLLLLGTRQSLSVASLLPAGLRELEFLSDCYWNIEDLENEVMAMLDQKRSMLPKLVRLAVAVNTEKKVKMVKRLSAACEAFDVQLVEDWA